MVPLDPSTTTWSALKASLGRPGEPIATDLSGPFHELAERLNGVLWIHDLRADRTVYVGRPYEQIWGRPRDEVFEAPGAWLRSVHPEDRERVRAARRLRNSGLYDVEYRILRPNGELRWIHDRCVLQHAGQTPVDYMVGIAEDITLTRTAKLSLRDITSGIYALTGEEFLNELTKRLSTALDAAVVVVGEVLDDHPDRGQTISVCVDGEICENFQYALDHTPCAQVALGQVCVYPDRLESFFPHNEFIQRTRACAYIGVPLLDVDGRVMGFLKMLSRTPLEEPEFAQYVLRFFGARVAAEIRRVRIEELERARLAEMAHASRIGTLGHLATGIAHEVNQPLAAIANYTSGLRRRLEQSGVTEEGILQAVEATAAEANRRRGNHPPAAFVPAARRRPARRGPAQGHRRSRHAVRARRSPQPCGRARR